MSDLVERVALVIQKADDSIEMEGAANGLSDDVSDWGATLARATIAIVLEEAARVADDPKYACIVISCRSGPLIAAAIRALADKEVK